MDSVHHGLIRGSSNKSNLRTKCPVFGAVSPLDGGTEWRLSVLRGTGSLSEDQPYHASHPSSDRRSSDDKLKTVAPTSVRRRRRQFVAAGRHGAARRPTGKLRASTACVVRRQQHGRVQLSPSSSATPRGCSNANHGTPDSNDGRRGSIRPGPGLCRGRHFGLEVPKVHEAVHVGWKSFEN